MKKRFYVDLNDGLFDTLKTRTELLSRSIDPNMTDDVVVTDSQKKIVATFFNEFVSEFRNQTGLYDEIKNYDGFIMYEIDETVEKNIEKLKPTLEQCIVEYLLMRWYDAIGLGEISMSRRQVYLKIMADWRNNSTRKAFVTPKYTPYF